MLTAAILDYIVREIRFQDWTFRTSPMDDGFCVQVQFTAPDSATGAPQPQRGRKWYVSPHATESEVVLTCLKAVLTALEHEARERFTYRGIAPFGPHVDVRALLVVAEQQDRRKEVAQA